jgi:protein-S-isoprenylcysteine O-methyltransferase Ste14
MTSAVTPEALLLAVIALSWLVFAIVLLRRSPLSLLGIALQGVAFGVAFGVRRVPSTPFIRGPLALRWAASAFIAALTIGAVMLAARAVGELGRQWSLQARVLADHALVTTGPFAHVRHPIYTGMAALCVATGLALSTGPAVLATLGFFAAGTWLRVQSEERLLRERFGPTFDAYAARIPAVVPRWRAG